MINLEDALKLLLDSDRVRIIENGKEIYNGFLAGFEKEKHEMQQVEKMRCIPEIRHKKWKELQLMSPMQPEEAAEYSFSDLEMKLYYTINITG